MIHHDYHNLIPVVKTPTLFSEERRELHRHGRDVPSAQLRPAMVSRPVCFGVVPSGACESDLKGLGAGPRLSEVSEVVGLESWRCSA